MRKNLPLGILRGDIFSVLGFCEKLVRFSEIWDSAKLYICLVRFSIAWYSGIQKSAKWNFGFACFFEIGICDVKFGEFKWHPEDIYENTFN